MDQNNLQNKIDNLDELISKKQKNLPNLSPKDKNKNNLDKEEPKKKN